MRPATTGLATAFFRFYLLDTLSRAPARPASILAHLAAENLPFATGAFGRALRSLLEGGYLVPARGGMVALSALGVAERIAERDRWSAVLPSVTRLLGGVTPPPAPVAEVVPVQRATIADSSAERALVADGGEWDGSAAENGEPLEVVLVVISIEDPNEPIRRAVAHRPRRRGGGAR